MESKENTIQIQIKEENDNSEEVEKHTGEQEIEEEDESGEEDEEGEEDETSEDDEEEEDETSEDDEESVEEEEPKLKYKRLEADIGKILTTQAASAMAVSKRLVVLGTHNGEIFILDFDGNKIKQYSSNSATISIYQSMHMKNILQVLQ